jgi:hypothetical protein
MTPAQPWVRFVATASDRCGEDGMPIVVLRLARHTFRALTAFTVLEVSCRAPLVDSAFAPELRALPPDAVEPAPR